MPPILDVTDLRKAYSDGFEALKGVNLQIEEGEILALLGPNGAGKTTLISTVCGITTATSGTVRVGGHDTITDFRAARSLIGLTHYIEEAEAIADRIGVIAGGEILLVEDKDKLMARMGKKELEVQLSEPVAEIPASLVMEALRLSDDGTALIYTYDTNAERTGITKLLGDVAAAGLVLRDVVTRQSSLEDIFVDLVHEGDAP